MSRRNMVLAAVLSALATAGAVAAGGVGNKTVVVADPATQLSASPGGTELDLHVAFSSGCTSVSVWRLSGAPQTLARPACSLSRYGLSLTREEAVWATLTRRADSSRVYELWRSDSGSSQRRPNARRQDPYSKPRRVVRRVVPPGAGSAG